MPEDLSPQYNPKEVEPKWADLWSSSDVFHAVPDPQKKPFTIVIPPPNVTGILHMGHALNNTIQDILIRKKRMEGCEALWMPGTDHAGIATQNVVERQIAKEKLTRQDLGREKFIERVWSWKNEYGSTIVRQLKRMGAGCDWSRERFTMDTGYSEAVVEVFVRLYDKGLIYRGDRIINWCPRCQTALSDEEAPHHDTDGKLYYIKYPIKESQSHKVTKSQGKAKAKRVDGVIVATTRPETMLGDTAVAVHPNDKRYKDLVGAILVLPLIGREIKIIADELIDKSFGTGAVKVTPAHDPNDYAMGKTHGLLFINIMGPDGVLNAQAGDFAGMDRFEAREAVLEALKEQKLLVKVEEHKHAVGHCYRCHTVIEPYLSKQWFVKMGPLAGPAIRAVKKGTIRFTPKRWTKVYLNWMENIKDWCISRQIWWGHRLPVWYCGDCDEVIVARETPRECPKCHLKNLRQDEDVLDTWFSSWLWPFATFGWPFQSSQVATSQGHKESDLDEKRKELEYFYPTNVLVTAPEIIFFWVARMIMAGYEFMGKAPFSDVTIHGTVRDDEGRKMSKSLGNSIDPLLVIDTYGADALRFSLIACTATGSDVLLSEERFEQGRNFANKIWNASRFILMNLKESVTGDGIDLAACRVQDRWILSRLAATIKGVDRALEGFKFNEALNLVQAFFWHDFCDWYVEIAKLDLGDANVQEVLLAVLKRSLAMLHPFMPFITDEVAGRLPGAPLRTLACSAWPEAPKEWESKAEVKSMELVRDVVLAVRQKRADLKLPPTTKLSLRIWAGAGKDRALLNDTSALVQRLALVEKIEPLPEDRPQPKTVSFLVRPGVKVFVVLEGLLDVEREKKRLEAELAEIKGLVKQKEGLLSNAGFVKRAPAEVVAKERERLEELKGRIGNIQEVRRALG